ncbi:MAG TPA: hypothetical protein VN650_09130 [Gemmatimonadaceae bacterium]|nr:hypothetical protein [Gemmatimonadaceae bacterium]
MTATPKWLKPIGIIALIWNLIGVIAFVMDLRLTPADVAKLSAAQQAMYAARPAWSVAATGIAVCAGALGCIGLIIGKRWAHPLLVLSLLGVILQDVSLFGMSGAMAQAGSTAVILQCVVLVVALGLAVLASKGTRNGWLA